MRVLFNTVGIFNNNLTVKNKKDFTVKNSAVNNAQFSPSPISAEYFRANYLQQDLSFEANRIKKKRFSLTQYHDYISCPCCGEKMFYPDKKWQEKFAKETANKRGKMLASAIKNNIKEFQVSKREIALLIADNALIYPDKYASELLEEISPMYIDSLQAKQIVVLNDMANELKIRKKNKSRTIQNWYDNQMNRIKNAKHEGEFRNKNLVRAFTSLAYKLKIDIGDKKIQAYFDKLPNSMRDIDAFVVKYKRRPSEETIRKMLKNTACSIEHIVPFYKTEDNNCENILLMCSDCNSARGNMDYREFLKLYPYMHKNIKKYFKDIETVVNNRITTQSAKNECRNYVKNVSKTLATYTKGELQRTSNTNTQHRKRKKHKNH